MEDHVDDYVGGDIDEDDCDGDDDVDDCDGDDAASPSGINMIMMGKVGEGEGDCDESWVSRVFDIRSHVKALFAAQSVEMRYFITSIMEF